MRLWNWFKSRQPFFYKREILKVSRGKDGERVTTSFKARSYGFTATGWVGYLAIPTAIFIFFNMWAHAFIGFVLILFFLWRGCVDRKAFEAIRPRLEEYLGLDKRRT